MDKHSDPKMGARPLKRAIQNLIEDKLAEEVLSGKIQAGDRVQADFEAGEFSYKDALKKWRNESAESFDDAETKPKRTIDQIRSYMKGGSSVPEGISTVDYIRSLREE